MLPIGFQLAMRAVVTRPIVDNRFRATHQIPYGLVTEPHKNIYVSKLVELVQLIMSQLVHACFKQLISRSGADQNRCCAGKDSRK